jgi:hypothetical protein|tara:strand:- start:179 stop:439 length:261 start_codon:yes stop_codon:yes gene_type:complete
MTDKPAASKSSKVKKVEEVFTVVAVFSEDEVKHSTCTSLEEVNSYINSIEDGGNHALVFVTKGTLMPESEWRIREQDEEQQYWTVI